MFDNEIKTWLEKASPVLKELDSAILEGSLEKVRVLLASSKMQDAMKNAPPFEWWSDRIGPTEDSNFHNKYFLKRAVSVGCVEIVKELIAIPAVLSAEQVDGAALIAAANVNNLTIFDLLFGISYVEKAYENALYRTFCQGNSDAFNRLLEVENAKNIAVRCCFSIITQGFLPQMLPHKPPSLFKALEQFLKVDGVVAQFKTVSGSILNYAIGNVILHARSTISKIVLPHEIRMCSTWMLNSISILLKIIQDRGILLSERTEKKRRGIIAIGASAAIKLSLKELCAMQVSDAEWAACPPELRIKSLLPRPVVVARSLTNQAKREKDTDNNSLSDDCAASSSSACSSETNEQQSSDRSFLNKKY